MKNEQDENAVVVDTDLKPVDCQWSHDGSILAIIGRTSENNAAGANQNAIHMYSSSGKLLRTMKLPGNQISGLTWEGYSLRLAFAIDSFIYLAQVKHDYMWTCFSNTLVYHFNKRNKPESYIMFWDTKNNEVGRTLQNLVNYFAFLKLKMWFTALREASEAICRHGILWRSLRISNSA